MRYFCRNLVWGAAYYNTSITFGVSYRDRARVLLFGVEPENAVGTRLVIGGRR